MNALQLSLTVSDKETLLQTFFKRGALLHRKRQFCVFEPLFVGGMVLRGNVR